MALGTTRRAILVLSLAALVSACDDAKPGAAPAPSGKTDEAAAVPIVSAAPAAEAAASASAPPTDTAADSAPAAPPDRVAAQHVLVTYKGAKGAPPTVKRSKAEAKALAAEIAKKAHEGDDFAALVAAHSEDPGSKDRMGSVGKFTRDKMTKAFSDAAFALAVDGVSDPVETPFGFHVIKRNQ